MEPRIHYAKTGDGLRVAYQRAGSGQPLVLLHGFIADSRVWRRQMEDLSRDFDVVAWDAPGCGQSSDPPEEFTMAEFADSLAGLIEHSGVPSAHVLGLSWGGTLAMQFHRKYPASVRSLILADTYAGMGGLARAGGGGAEAGEVPARVGATGCGMGARVGA